MLAIPSLSKAKKKTIIKQLSDFPIQVSVLPSVEKIIDGKVSLDDIQHVDVVDVLGRKIVMPKDKLLRSNITKKILITGAGGSTGSELSRQIFHLEANKIVLLDNSEFNLYSIQQEFEQLQSKTKMVSALCTVTNYYQLKNLILEHEIHSIYHAAAYSMFHY